jgi:hypothetical protein
METRGWFSRADSTPFAILSFRLVTMSENGSPVRAVQDHILAYFTDDQIQNRTVELFDLPFSLGMKTAVKTFKTEAVALARDLKV